MMINKNGFIYSATHLKYLKEAEQSVLSLIQSGNEYPISLVLPSTLANNIQNKDVFDQIIYRDDLYSYSAKIDALICSPYEKTVFLDGDTVVISKLNELFSLLNHFDIAVCPERNASHSINLEEQHFPHLQETIYEFNTGVIAVNKNARVQDLLVDWKDTFNMNLSRTKNDQVSFRIALIKSDLRIAALPIEYNFRGLSSFQIAVREVKILHERLGGMTKSNRTMENLPEVLKKMRKINRFHAKRLIFSFWGMIIVVPYNRAPDNFLRSIMNKLKITKKVKKSDAFSS